MRIVVKIIKFQKAGCGALCAISLQIRASGVAKNETLINATL